MSRGAARSCPARRFFKVCGDRVVDARALATLAAGTSFQQSSAQYVPYRLQTESEIRLSAPLLKRVVDTLPLQEAWGARHEEGGKPAVPNSACTNVTG